MYNTIDAINACNVQAVCIDMKFNATKSVAIRVVTHFNIKFAPLVLCGIELTKFVNVVNYFGVQIL